MKKCKFCTLIAEIKDMEKIIKRKEAVEKLGITSVLKVKLSNESWDKNNRLRGRVTYGSCDLNFCPKCGRKIDRTETVT